MLNFPALEGVEHRPHLRPVRALAVPSFLPPIALDQLPGWMQEIKVNFGLDLAGGSQLLLEAETGDVARQRLESLEDTSAADPPRRVPIARSRPAGDQLGFTVRNPAQLQQATQIVREPDPARRSAASRTGT